MELDDLKQGWSALDRRLATLEMASVASAAARGVRAELLPLAIGQTVQLLFCLGMVWVVAPFWVRHLDTAALVVAGLLVHAWGVAGMICAARNLVLVARASHDAPVVELQQRVAALRAWRIREGRWLGLAGCVLWVPLLVCAFGAAGINVVTAMPLYVACNVVASLVCVGVFLAVSKRSRRPEGKAVARARERLDEVGRFLEG